MKKRVLAGILMTIMVLASVMGVSAAESIQAQIYVTKAQESGYRVVTDPNAEFANLKAADAAMYDLVTGFNNKKVTQDKMLEAAPAAVKEAVKGKGLIWKIFDLIPVNGGTPVAGIHTVTLEVPALTSSNTDLKVIHYSEVDKAWEVLEATVDYSKKTVTIKTDDLSPIGIYANNVKNSGNGISPSTGVTSSAWMLWSALALIVLGAGVVVSQKKRV